MNQQSETLRRAMEAFASINDLEPTGSHPSERLTGRR